MLNYLELINTPKPQHYQKLFIWFPYGGCLRPVPAAPTQPPQRRYPQRQRRPPTRIDLWPRPLFFRGRCSGGPVEAAYAPGLWPDQHGNSTSYSSTVVHCVQSLRISRYVYSTKSVLSKPLSRYLLLVTSRVDFFVLYVECVYWTEPKATCRPYKSRPNAYNMYTDLEEILCACLCICVIFSPGVVNICR